LELNAEDPGEPFPEGRGADRRDDGPGGCAGREERFAWFRIRHLLARARVNLKLGRSECERENLSEAKAVYAEMGVEGGTGELRSIEEELRNEEARGGGARTEDRA